MPDDQLLEELIAKALQPLQDRISALEVTITNLQEENSALAATQAHLTENQEIQLRLIGKIRDSSKKNIDPSSSPAESRGKKTSARIAKLKKILKAHGGSQTFKKLQEDLDLSPSEFTYLVGCLDKRSFEVGRRPGTKRGEKVLSLRVRIMEPVVFK